ncbi:hypothetical protein BCR35DRAFT_194723 [Leucosporidium creatinivorum]|uniref:GmrSD restriction endonucleases N-terminal domain-containing protein n=1 Tax=Leucosporidium creatinivorum TaxID=106004 RepID=A0A1Y2DTY4_9BASI|nr:hypothetical protein BCR35DRAFT_194723 [Leucosporidium creatinivorum]
MKELYKMMESGKIRLNPKYQRGDVWQKDRRSLLISSLFKNLHVPELLFNIHEIDNDEEDDDSDSGSSRTVWDACDGKQRMTSILKFMRGEIPVKDDTGTSYYYPTSSNLDARCLDSTMKATFDKFRVRYGAYHDLNDAQETLLFNRVQGGIPLSTAEVLKSNSGPWSTWIRELCDRYFNESPTSLSPRITVPIRASEFITMIYMARVYFEGLTAVQVLSPTQLRAIVTSHKLPSANKRKEFDAILERLRRLTLVKAWSKDKAMNPSAVQRARAAGWKWPHRVFRPERSRVVSPVELDFLPLLIARWPTLSDGDLLEVIGDYRDFVYEKFGSERKRNVKVIGSISEWIRTRSASYATSISTTAPRIPIACPPRLEKESPPPPSRSASRQLRPPRRALLRHPRMVSPQQVLPSARSFSPTRRRKYLSRRLGRWRASRRVLERGRRKRRRRSRRRGRRRSGEGSAPRRRSGKTGRVRARSRRSLERRRRGATS